MKTLEEMSLSPLIAIADIETLAKSPAAKIGAIGVVLVDVIEGREAGRFYTPVCLDSQLHREECQDTIEWWEQQKEQFPAAYTEMYAEDIERMSLRGALEALSAFLKANFGAKKIQLMGNGPEFDNVILAHAYEQAELEVPWHYSGNQSLRTALWMGQVLRGIEPKYAIAFMGTQHHALHDAVHEARCLLAVFKSIRNTMSNAR